MIEPCPICRGVDSGSCRRCHGAGILCDPDPRLALPPSEIQSRLRSLGYCYASVADCQDSRCGAPARTYRMAEDPLARFLCAPHALEEGMRRPTAPVILRDLHDVEGAWQEVAPLVYGPTPPGCSPSCERRGLHHAHASYGGSDESASADANER